MLDKINVYSAIKGKILKSSIKVLGNESMCEFPRCCLKYSIDNSSISIGIKNKEKKISLKKVELILKELSVDEFSHFIQSPEFINDQFIKKDINEISHESEISHFFTVLHGKDETEHILVGFLNSRSRNYIKIRKENGKIYLCLVYDFINHVLDSNESLELDKACFIQKNKEYELYSEYIEKICSNNNVDLDENYNKMKEYNISIDHMSDLFYKDNKSDFVLVNKSGYIKKKIHNKKQYLIDITNEKGKEEVINKVSKALDGKSCIYKISVRDYIEAVVESKNFNVYGAVDNIMKNILKEFNEIVIKGDDFPLGLALTNVKLLEKNISIEKNMGFMSKVLKKRNVKDEMNTELFYSMIIYTQLFNHSFNYEGKNQKIMDKLSFITKDYKNRESSHSNYIWKDSQISFKDKLGIYFKEEDVFSIWRYNDNKLYIGAFNLSKNRQKLYIDIEQHSSCTSTDGTCTSIFKDQDQILIKNKLYLKKLKEKSSIIFEKAI